MTFSKEPPVLLKTHHCPQALNHCLQIQRIILEMQLADELTDYQMGPHL